MWKWDHLIKNKLAFMSLIFLICIALLSIFAPYLTRFSYEEQNIVDKLQGPSLTHWLGTDALGRDLYSRIIYGARMSLSVGVLTGIFSLVLGLLIGTIAGYKGGWIDELLMRIVDLFYIFPSSLLAILLMLIFGRGFVGIIFTLSITSWITQARLVRAQILQIRELTYIEAAQALGARSYKIVIRHMIPNLLGPLIVSLTVQIPTNIMAESFLSFIGLGLQPPYSSWGTLSNEGFRAMQSFPHLIIFPGGVLFITMLAFNYLGDGIAEIFSTQPSGRL